MSAYYSRSWLTLTAGVDNESDRDISRFHQTSSAFGPRYKPNTGDGYYRLQISDSGLKDNTYFNLHDELKCDSRSSSRLCSRGWTLQEEAHSQRVLNIQHGQTSLRIGNNVYHESGLVPKIKETSFMDIDSTNLGSWIELVADYSQRNLTTPYRQDSHI
jgi:hypothetical protein